MATQKPETEQGKEWQAFEQIVNMLAQFDDDTKRRILKTVCVFLEIDISRK